LSSLGTYTLLRQKLVGMIRTLFLFFELIFPTNVKPHSGNEITRLISSACRLFARNSYLSEVVELSSSFLGGVSSVYVVWAYFSQKG